MPSVVIFRERLLPQSETFIRSQVGSMSKFKGIYAGCRHIPGLDLSDSPMIVMDLRLIGRVEELALKAARWAPLLAARLMKYEPVLLHAHFGPDGALAVPLARKLKIPLIVTFHGYDACQTDQTFRKDRRGRRYLRGRDALKGEASRFIAVSDYIARKLVEQGFPREKIQVHYIGVDTVQFRPDPAVPRKRIVLFVGRLIQNKGCEYLIRAMEPIQREMPDAELVILGDGPLRTVLEKQAKAVLQRYRFLGFQSSEAVRDWMTQASVLCTPSIVDASGAAEGFGIVFIEAQACGLPVVSFSTGGIPEAVAHGETGYLAPEKDWRSLSRYVVTLLKNQDVWKRFSSAGKERVKKLFDVRRQTEKLEHIYEDVIQGGCLQTSGRDNRQPIVNYFMRTDKPIDIGNYTNTKSA
jgi:colanic acid/amylovoran biosynthesis glycosyltransferase